MKPTHNILRAIRSSSQAIFSHKLAVLTLMLAKSVSTHAASVTLAWDPSLSTNVVGYKVYYGSTSSSYTNALTLGNVTEATIDGLNSGVKYYFAAKAISASGGESLYSNEVLHQPPNDTNYTLNLFNLAQTYDGTPKSVAVTTVPPGGGVAVTYDGLSTPPTAAGTYQVVATVTSANGKGAATNILTISRAQAKLVIGSVMQNYNGSPKPVTIGTVPVGLPVNVTYNSASAAPTDAGMYDVMAKVVDPNYDGIATAKLTISKALSPIPGMRLQWESLDEPVTIYHSSDLQNWEVLSNESVTNNAVVLPGLPGAHFFRATAKGDNGEIAISLAITREQ